MDLLRNLKKLNGYWWLVLGGLAYVGVVLDGAVSAFDITNLGASAYALVDWMQAAVLYFFLAAIFGHAIDWYLHHRKGRPLSHPDWFWYTTGFWFISTILAFAVVGVSSATTAWTFIFFPFVYGIFLPAFAFLALFPSLVKTTYYGKLILDAVYVAIFAGWMWLSWPRKLKQKVSCVWTRRILLIVLFIILLIGMVSCVQQLPPL